MRDEDRIYFNDKIDSVGSKLVAGGNSFYETSYVSLSARLEEMEKVLGIVYTYQVPQTYKVTITRKKVK